MNIRFDHIMPHPLASIQHGANSIWGNLIELEAGKKIMLNASSGKGKSTFTSVIFGLRTDFDGALFYGNQDTKNFKKSDWTQIRQEKISVVFQDLQLFPSLSVRENILIKNQLTDTFTEHEIKGFLEALEIETKWDQSCGLLSMGQQQRVAIIRSLCQPFDWLVLDEPFSHLDAENAQRALKLIDARCSSIQAGFVLTTLGDDYQFNFDKELNL